VTGRRAGGVLRGGERPAAARGPGGAACITQLGHALPAQALAIIAAAAVGVVGGLAWRAARFVAGWPGSTAGTPGWAEPATRTERTCVVADGGELVTLLVEAGLDEDGEVAWERPARRGDRGPTRPW
jgi:hypothetical protein